MLEFANLLRQTKAVQDDKVDTGHVRALHSKAVLVFQRVMQSACDAIHKNGAFVVALYQERGMGCG